MTNRNKIKSRKVSYSRSETSMLMMPNHANHFGKVHGGVMLQYIDQLAYICAAKHAGGPCVTVSVDRVDFIAPIEVGDVVTLQGAVNYVGTSSMEIGIRVTASNPQKGDIRHTNTSYVTMVGLDKNGKPIEVPGLVPDNDEDRERMKRAEKRATERRKIRKKETG